MSADRDDQLVPEDRCARCQHPTAEAPYYSDGVGDNATFNGQHICDTCAVELEDFVSAAEAAV